MDMAKNPVGSKVKPHHHFLTFELLSGQSGYRCSKCGEWIKATDHKKILTKCEVAHTLEEI